MLYILTDVLLCGTMALPVAGTTVGLVLQLLARLAGSAEPMRLAFTPAQSLALTPVKLDEARAAGRAQGDAEGRRREVIAVPQECRVPALKRAA